MNLADIGYPDQYFISFYIMNATNRQTLIRTEEREIPTLCHLECVLVQLPPSVTVFPGQPNNTVPVIIKAGNASKYLNLMKSTFHMTYNLILKYKLTPQSQYLYSAPMAIPVIGEKPYKLSLSVSNNTPNGTISLFEYSTSTRNENLSRVGVGGTNTNHLYLQVSQPPSPSLSQNLKTFLISQPLITILIPIILTAIISLAILWTVDINKSVVLHNSQ